MLPRLGTVLRHAWRDAADTRRALPPPAQQRLAAAVAQAEQGHTGELRICVEAALPGSYLWRHLREGTPMATLAQQRALMQFGKLGVWDTEHNNGVLVYVLLAEHRIELVADRAVHARVGAAGWAAVVAHLGSTIAAGQLEQGLSQALGEVAVHLRAHFPLAPGAPNPNELGDPPVLR